MPSAQLSGLALAELAIGAILVWSGIKDQSIQNTVTSLLKGQAPTSGSASPISQTATLTSANTTPSGTAPTVPSGSDYTSAQVEALWTALGGDPNQAHNAACHAMQESSGSTTVTSSNTDGGTNVGLFQLDTKGVGAGHTVAELQNATTNTQITIMATKNGTDWSSWATAGC